MHKENKRKLSMESWDGGGAYFDKIREKGGVGSRRRKEHEDEGKILTSHFTACLDYCLSTT